MPTRRLSSNAFARKVAKRPAKSEHCLQRACVDWCKGLGLRIVRGRFCAIPNGGLRDIVTASKLKAEGVRAGVPDLLFFREPGRVLWLELKNGTDGVVSKVQRDFHALLMADEHEVKVCRSLSEFIAAVSKFYALN